MALMKLGDIEKEIWMTSSWRVEQDEVDRIMEKVNQYVAQGGTGGGVDPGYHADQVAEALTRGRDEGYSDGRRALTVEDLPEAERERLDELRAGARSEGYTLGYNEGMAKGQGMATPPAPTAPALPSYAPVGTLALVDGAVWQLLGVPVALDSPAEKPPLPVRPVKRAVTREVSVQGTSQLRPDQRKCRLCQEIKDLEADFYRDAKGNQGRKTICKDCEVVTREERNRRKALETPVVAV